MTILALASDYDGTLADDGVTSAETIAALGRFKASGRKLLLVTGRPLGELYEVFADVGLFDVVVAENGGLLHFPGGGISQALAPAPAPEFVARLQQRGIGDLAVGRTIVATTADRHAVVAASIAEMGLDLQIILNTDALMVLPRGIDKASGLRAALAAIDLQAAAVVGVGDAENDVAFLQVCGHAVAVSNALSEVKAVVQRVTNGARGAGVAELIDLILATGTIG